MVALAFMLFTNDPALAAKAAEAGIDRVVVDIETRGKLERQTGYHLEMNRHRIEDLQALRGLPLERVLRVNVLHPGSGAEIDAGIACGADWLMLPMVRHPEEVRRFVDMVAGRARVIPLVETLPGLMRLVEISRMDGVDEVYVGLNDLRLEAGWNFGFRFLAEGVLDVVAAGCAKPFGFGGLTVMDGGSPLPTRDILREMARLGASRVILRRAFKRDVAGRDMGAAVAALRKAYAACRRRPAARVEAHRKAVWARIMEIDAALAAKREDCDA
jgi:hypothetical protein